jgi:hypothetical protein
VTILAHIVGEAPFSAFDAKIVTRSGVWKVLFHAAPDVHRLTTMEVPSIDVPPHSSKVSPPPLSVGGDIVR